MNTGNGIPDRPTNKRVTLWIARVLFLPFSPFVAIGLWASSDLTYWEAFKKVWEI